MRIEHLFSRALVALPLLAAAAACSSSTAPSPAPAASTAGAADEALDRAALGQIVDLPSADFCSHVHGPGIAHCNAKVRVNADGSMAKTATPQGLTPAQLASAYALTAAGGSGKTVAIVDAYDDPNAESDLAVYRNQFGLPACTTANGCLKKVGQDGSSNLPPADSGWAGEISLDLDMVSAACPSCNILLVEANSASGDDLGTGVNAAAALGASAISNSYGGNEDSTVTAASLEYYDHPGILVAASAGDGGYGAQFPASSQYVLSVGGTSLVTSSSSTRGWVEAAWSDGGSGCSAYIAKPSWQTDTICGSRVIADVSCVADPNTGVAVYDTYGGSSAGATGWIVVGGTSVGPPFVSAVFTRLGLSAQGPSYAWGNTSQFFDVTTGSNGTCSPAALCTAETGYDGPTGWGTPNGAVLGTACTPSCSGLHCGSDGCSGSCGTCASGDTCIAGQCVAPCTPSCSGKSCGSDGCGGHCGDCPEGDTCSAKGACIAGDGSCIHSECSTGKKLKKGCDACVTEICDSDTYCCHFKWDSICVAEAGSICGDTCPGK